MNSIKKFITGIWYKVSGRRSDLSDYLDVISPPAPQFQAMSVEDVQEFIWNFDVPNDLVERLEEMIDMSTIYSENGLTPIILWSKETNQLGVTSKERIEGLFIQ